MDSYEYGELLKSLHIKCENIAKILNPADLQKELERIEAIQSDEAFWNDAQKATEVAKQKRKIERILGSFNAVKQELDDAQELYEIATSEVDSSTLELLLNLFPPCRSISKRVKLMLCLVTRVIARMPLSRFNPERVGQSRRIGRVCCIVCIYVGVSAGDLR